MIAIQSVHLVYFSGTGGTTRVAASFEKAFASRQITIHKTVLNQKMYEAVPADLLVLFYPVYALNAPKPIDEWIEQAPNGNGSPAVVISVSGGGEMTPNTACRVDVIRKLKKKGYTVSYEDMIVMPSNIFIDCGDDLTALILQALPRKTEKIVTAILAGESRRTKPLLFDRILAPFATLEKKYFSTIFGKHLKTTDACNGCAACTTICSRSNITMRNKRPVFGGNCVFCLGCVYGCAQEAIVPGIGKAALLKGGFNLKAVESRTRQKTVFPPVALLARGIMMKGVRDYIKENE